MLTLTQHNGSAKPQESLTGREVCSVNYELNCLWSSAPGDLTALVSETETINYDLICSRGLQRTI